MKRALILAACLAGCYSPRLADGQYLCPDKRCPDGQVCSACGVCVSAGAGAASCPGCALGARSMGDPGLPNLAFCPAAWTVPGLSASAAPASAATPCGRNPNSNGRSLDNKIACTVEDSCAAGWHVCAGDAEAQARGLSGQICDGLDAFANFWTTRQPGAFRGADINIISCAPSGTTRLIGCGSLYGRGTRSCAALTRHLGTAVAAPGVAAFDCSTASQGAWVCGAPGMEAALVTKPNANRGGVLCCRDVIAANLDGG